MSLAYYFRFKERNLGIHRLIVFVIDCIWNDSRDPLDCIRTL